MFLRDYASALVGKYSRTLYSKIYAPFVEYTPVVRRDTRTASFYRVFRFKKIKMPGIAQFSDLVLEIMIM